MVCSLSKNTYIENTETVKLLGFVIDHKLMWNGHTEHVCKKLSRVVYLLRRLKSVITDQYLVTVYHALFHSHITYGLQLWGHSSGCKDVLLLQKKAVRIITSSRRHEHCRPLLKKLGIMTVYSHYVFLCLLHVKENLHSFIKRHEVHEHNTRDKENINVPMCRLSKTRDSFPMIALRMFRSLPMEVQLLPLEKFKNKIARDLKLHPLYSVQEFFDCEESE